MPANVEKLANQPIIIASYHGHITVDDAKAVFAQVAGLIDIYGAPLYRIACVDCDSAHTSFDEVMMLTTLSSKGLRGSATDPDVKTVLVGEHLLIDLYVDAMRQEAFGAVEIPIFETLEDALAHVQSIIQNDQAAGGA